MDSFIYEIEYREVLQYPHTYAMPRAPIGIGFKWCKGWKKVKHVFSVAGRAYWACDRVNTSKKNRV